ncbi:MAG: hypothetical protein IJL97_03285 [Lachnospiraceae bacterium]|nr:hypothetical protein [Lachnospiraceae bacterium]
MSFIRTVTGDIRPEELGFTQCHEHLMITKGRSYEMHKALLLDDPEKSAAEALRLRNAGGQTLVDSQPVGCNRDISALKYISEKSGLNIIASTGFHKRMFYYETSPAFRMDEKELTKLFIAELTEGACADPEGMDASEGKRSGIKAGIIKTALDSCGLDGHYLKLFKAALNAKKETGCPMMVHIEKGSDPLALADFIRNYGVRDENLYFCHMDRACDDRDVMLRVIDIGFPLEFDTIGRFKYHSDEFEIDIMKTIIENDFEDMLLFSLDTTRERLKTYTEGAVGLDYIITTFIPKMRESGIDEKIIHKIAFENPARCLAWKE